MKEPDKIYVSIGYEAQTKPFHHSIEYIRKDALLEWAKAEKAKCSDETHPYAQFMNVIIDKLNSV